VGARYDAGVSTPAAVNWAGNLTFSAVRLTHPASLDELCELVVASDQVRALGAGHSFSAVADTTGTLVRLDRLPPIIDIDASSLTATVSAGLRYSDIVATLDAEGFALANLASLPHITVAGAAATGTHGSGDRLRNLADAVVALRIIPADGEPVWLRRGDPDFPGAVVALGALGIVTDVCLRVEPAFEVAQEVRLDVPLDEIAESWDEVFAAAYSVSAFTSYGDGRANVFLKHRAGAAGSGWSGGRTAKAPVHPIPVGDPAACTQQLGVPGPWYERLPHFRADAVPSAGNELQSEFFVARPDAPAALEALRGIADRVAPVLQISELRMVAADDQWLSPAYGRDCVAFHFTWIRDTPSVLPVVEAVEKALLPLGARPHWGKVSTAETSEIVSRYPRAAQFASLRRRFDPAGTFANAYTRELFPS
jgi:xylitol oxidase